MQLSSLLLSFNEPETLKMAKMARALRTSGVDVTDLSLGEPDFNTPDHIREAAKKAIDQHFSHYTPVPGFLDLREAACKKLERENKLTYSPEQIVFSTGAKQSIANLVLAVVDKGDEVIIPTPYWVTYSEIVKLAGGIPVMVKTGRKQDFKILPDQLEQNITARTKMFMFSSPCNPTGTVYSKQELQGLADVFERHPNIVIMSDEIYEHINFVGEHHSMASFDSIKNRVVVINGLSKGYAMTGWRVGYLAAPLEIAKACEKIQGQFTSATNSIAQRAAIAALTGDMAPTEFMRLAFLERRNKVLEWVKEIPGLPCNIPDGAFYIFPDVSYYFGKTAPDGSVIQNADDLSLYFLNHGHVSSVSGSAFGEPDCIRLSFANSIENLEKGFLKIKKALEELN